MNQNYGVTGYLANGRGGVVGKIVGEGLGGMTRDGMIWALALLARAHTDIWLEGEDLGMFWLEF